MAEGEELAIEFYKPGNARDLADSLIGFLTNTEKQQAMAIQNFSTALRMTMPTVVLKYLRHFELEQRTEVLRQITRFRRLPGWVPSKSLMLRLMTRNSTGWVHRSAVPRPRSNSSGQKLLLNNHVNGGGKLGRTGIPVNGDGIAAAGGGRSGRRDALSSNGTSATGDGTHANADDSDQAENLSLAPTGYISHEEEAAYPEGQQQTSVDWERIVPLRQVHPGNGSGGNGKGGSSSPGAGSDGSGRESTTQAGGSPGTRK
jgi:hypothetical protein